jgi:hypothetical protein
VLRGSPAVRALPGLARRGVPVLTLYTIPKAFRGHIGVIQRNAITSWTRLEPRPEIILFGKDEGTADLARELAVRHQPEVAANDRGTPLVNDLFARAEAAAKFDWLCYVNADILLTSEFLQAVQWTRQRLVKALMISKRINLDLQDSMLFGPAWERDLKERVRTAGEEGHYSSIDAFAHPKGLYPEIPEFAIGRLWWDHWLIKAVRQQGFPVVDASRAAPLIHQNHDYNHTPGGADEVWRGVEAKRNFELCGGVQHAYTLLDATHELTSDGALRRVRWRKPVFKMKALAWDLLVQRTARARHALGLRRKAAPKAAT